jgi:hypothetical protein
MARRNAALNKLASILRWACSEKFPAALVALNQKEAKKNINKACREVATEILKNVPLMMDQIWLCITEGEGVSLQTAWADEEECLAFASSQLREWMRDNVELLLNKDAVCKAIKSLLDKDKIADAMGIWNILEESDKKVYVIPLTLNGC